MKHFEMMLVDLSNSTQPPPPPQLVKFKYETKAKGDEVSVTYTMRD